MLGGIGFTMSIFITLLAFKNDGEDVITYSKIAILIASFVAGTMGYFWLKFTLKRKYNPSEIFSQVKFQELKKLAPLYIKKPNIS